MTSNSDAQTVTHISSYRIYKQKDRDDHRFQLVSFAHAYGDTDHKLVILSHVASQAFIVMEQHDFDSDFVEVPYGH